MTHFLRSWYNSECIFAYICAGKFSDLRRDMNKKNWLIPLAIVILAAAIMVFALLTRPQADENMVVISVDGKEWARVPLSKPQTVTVEQEDGSVNVIEISDHGAVMESSTCHNQLCVQMGEVTVDNWEYRPNQQFIICLPNRVSVELMVAQ